MEIGATAPITVTINEVSHEIMSQTSSTPGVNLVLIDLQQFGVMEASALTISSSSILNDIAAIGGINVAPVPEATTLVIWLLAALCFLPTVRRLRHS
jgi:hypothetical protein